MAVNAMICGGDSGVLPQLVAQIEGEFRVMKKIVGNAALALTLGALGSGAMAQGSGAGIDELGVDFYLQSDHHNTAFNKPRSNAQFYERQISWMLDNHYAPASILMSSVGRGMTLADTAYFMAKAQPEQASQIYSLATDIMPALPGWACSGAGSVDNRYSRPLRSRELPPETTLEHIAALYFNEGRRFLEYPQWRDNEGHVDVSVDELIGFKRQEIDETGDDSWWYMPDDEVKTNVVVASLYPQDRRVVIDSRLEDLEALKEEGADKVPVMLLYANARQVPISDFVKDADSGGDSASDKESDRESDKDGDKHNVAVRDVLARFGTTGEQALPTRDWHRGDHHLQVEVKELQGLYDIPERDEIAPEDWQRWEQQLKSGLEQPLLITAYNGAQVESWLNEKGLVAVAAEMELERLPVVFFYHANERQACGLPAECVTHLQEAIERGSGIQRKVFVGPNRVVSPRTRTPARRTPVRPEPPPPISSS